jgi:hypothetical protein
MVLTFRGHSFSLEANMPTDIFGNSPNAHILFIPGSCGSSGSVPLYLSSNPETDIDFVANTSTGKGQVTNALIDMFILAAASAQKDGYVKLINRYSSMIVAQDGDPKTLKASTPGEQMLENVFKIAPPAKD